MNFKIPLEELLLKFDIVRVTPAGLVSVIAIIIMRKLIKLIKKLNIKSENPKNISIKQYKIKVLF